MKYQDMKELALNWDCKVFNMPYHSPEDFRTASCIMNSFHEDKMELVNTTEYLIKTCIEDHIELDRGLISATNYMLLKHRSNSAGDFRKQSVKVGSYIPPDGIFVKELLDALMADMDNLTPIEFYKILECIHPFDDGNGRTGGILLVYMSYLASDGKYITIPLQ